MTTPDSSYPHDLAGDPADPPLPAPPDLLEAWREYEAAERELVADEEPLFAAGSWRPAPAIARLFQEADAANPRRDKRSDGIKGDARHAGLNSGHNPDARGVVVAGDFDVDGLDVPGAFERARQAVLAGRLPQLEGGYLIHAGRITSPDFRTWREYHGDNPHITHGHAETAHDPRRADDERPWNIWTAGRPAPARPGRRPAPQPAPPAVAAWTGPDLRGRSTGLRGEYGANGPRFQALQRFLRDKYPLYAKGLRDDGWWGDESAAVLHEFARRSGIRSADGRNIGPRIARALLLAGFRG